MKVLDLRPRVIIFDREHPLPRQTPQRRAYLQAYRKRYLLEKREKIVAYRRMYYQQHRQRLIEKSARNKRKRRK